VKIEKEYLGREKRGKGKGEKENERSTNKNRVFQIVWENRGKRENSFPILPETRDRATH